MKKLSLSLVALFLLLSHYQLQAQNYPADFSQVEVASGIVNPTAMAFAPDGRIFVAQQNGVLHVIKNGVKLATPAITLSVDSNGERGLIGIALHPSFSANGIIYLHYTLPDGSRNRISRFWLNGDVLNPASEQIIYNLDALGSDTNHNGGAMVFHNNKLYIGVGDNGTRWKARDTQSTHGKILRINADGSTPGDNVVYPGPVWGYGLRNPYTLDIDPATGKIFVNDVGENNWEEINDATTKANFGWPDTEGPTSNSSFRSPVFAYQHGSGDGKGCAISGGAFFNPAVTAYPSTYKGTYFYQDLCNNWINYLDLTNGVTRNAFATGLPGQSLGLRVGADGNLYFLSRQTGTLYKIIYNSSAPPTISDHPDAVTVNQYATTTLSVAVEGAAPMSYQWLKNGAAIPGANALTYTITDAQAEDAGSYAVEITNSYGSATSDPATVTVQENRPPEVTIYRYSNPDFYRYRGGEMKYFQGFADDPEEGSLYSGWRYPDGQSTSEWELTLDFYKDGQFQYRVDTEAISEAFFSIPYWGETSPNVFYRVKLAVTDSRGKTGYDSLDLLPYLSQVTLQTSPPGLELVIDEQVVQTPFTFTGVEGVQRWLAAPWPQSQGGTNYTFEAWPNGSRNNPQDFRTPMSDTTVVATYIPTTDNWMTTDIGPVAIPGYTTIDDGVFTLQASGKDIWETSDEFHYVYQPINGNVDIRVQVIGMLNTVHSWAKTGVMIRETLQANSKHAMNVITPSQGIAFQRRTQTAGSTISNGTPGTMPSSLRLVRIGNTFTAYTSTDGNNWTQTGTQTFAMNSNAYVGLVLTSHSAGNASSATLNEVSVGIPTAGTAFAESISDAGTALKVFPNPVRGDATWVEFPSETSLPGTLQLLNSVGQIVWEKALQSADEITGGLEIEMNNVAKGYYILRMNSARENRKVTLVRE